jgi:predicted ATPase
MSAIGRDKIILIGKEILPEFEIKDSDIHNYEKLFYYFTKNETKCNELNIDLGKSLWLYGEVGSGKTIAMKVFQDFCAYTPHLGNRRFSIYWFQKVIREFEDREKRKFISELYGYDAKKDICFDEFMRKSNLKDYGVDENLAETLIDERYEALSNHGFKTYITTNVSPVIVKADKLLDHRTLDRCKQMFNIIEWEGGTKRV